jgi:hypothetical protein
MVAVANQILVFGLLAITNIPLQAGTKCLLLFSLKTVIVLTAL